MAEQPEFIPGVSTWRRPGAAPAAAPPPQAAPAAPVVTEPVVPLPPPPSPFPPGFLPSALGPALTPEEREAQLRAHHQGHP
jgi:hypothetical protein